VRGNGGAGDGYGPRTRARVPEAISDRGPLCLGWRIDADVQTRTRGHDVGLARMQQYAQRAAQRRTQLDEQLDFHLGYVVDADAGGRGGDDPLYAVACRTRVRSRSRGG
jgi:hypothetical protein